MYIIVLVVVPLIGDTRQCTPCVDDLHRVQNLIHTRVGKSLHICHRGRFYVIGDGSNWHLSDGKS